MRPGSKDSSTAGAPTYPWHWAAPTTGSPVWIRLAEWTAGGHHLLHGSGTPDLHRLEPRAPLDFSPDDYSKRTAVFATEDPTWNCYRLHSRVLSVVGPRRHVREYSDVGLSIPVQAMPARVQGVLEMTLCGVDFTRRRRRIEHPQ